MSPFISACLRPTALAAAILSALPLMARADDTSPVVSSSTVTLSNLHFELIDLNPNDGVTPSVTFDLTGQLSISGIAGADSVTSTYSNTLLPSTPTTVVSANGRSSIVTTADSVTLKSVTTLQDLTAAGVNFATTSGFTTNYWNGNSSANVSVNNPQSVAGSLAPLSFGQFTLSANTILRITGTVTSSSSLDAAPLLQALPTTASNPTLWINKDPYPSSTQLAIGKLDIQHSGSTINVLDVQGSMAGLPVHPGLSVDQTNTKASDTQSQGFELIYTNLHGASETGDVLWTLGASNNLNMRWTYLIPDVPSIPEPSSYALMGLGLVGIALARPRIAR